MRKIPEFISNDVFPRSGEVPELLFHVAAVSDRESIKEEGLYVNPERTWNQGLGANSDGDRFNEETGCLQTRGDNGEWYDYEWRPHAVFMWHNIEEAISYMNNHEKYDIYILRKEDVEGILRDPSVAANWDYDSDHHAYMTLDGVKPEHCHRVPDLIKKKMAEIWKVKELSWDQRSDEFAKMLSAIRPAEVAEQQSPSVNQHKSITP